MIDPALLRNHLQQVAAALQSRGQPFDSAEFAEMERARKALETESQQLRAKRKAIARRVGHLVGRGMSKEEALRSAGNEESDVNRSLDEIDGQLRALKSRLEEWLLMLPNLPSEDVPQGLSEEHNVEVSRWGEPRAFDFEPLDHVELGARIQGMDFPAGAVLAGSRFVVLSGLLAKLQRVLGQFLLDLHVDRHGYTEVYVPLITKEQSLVGTGQLPKFGEDLFAVGSEEENLYMIPTAETPLANLARDRILAEDELPLRYACLSPCFRSEAGSYGKDVRGMIRQRQFEKVELVQLCRPQDAGDQLEELTSHAEQALRLLELPYRKMLLCAGDMGVAARKTYDLEVWLPSQRTYREISSCSDCGDFQARRMQARWRRAPGEKPRLLNTLNGSGVAVGRALVAIIENFQNRDGSIEVPAVLQEQMRCERIAAP